MKTESITAWQDVCGMCGRECSVMENRISPTSLQRLSACHKATVYRRATIRRGLIPEARDDQ